MSPHRMEGSADRGVSLVELAIYVVLLGIVAAIVAAVMLSLFRSQVTVSGITNTTSDSQNVFSVLQGDVRSARQFQSSGDGRTLTLSTASRDATATWQCVRWTITGTGTTQKVNRAVKATAWPTPTAMLNGVRQRGTDLFFTGSADMGVRGLLRYSMQVATANNGVIDVVGSVNNTAQGTGTDTNCFP